MQIRFQNSATTAGRKTLAATVADDTKTKITYTQYDL
jgi:hypothetical protein